MIFCLKSQGIFKDEEEELKRVEKSKEKQDNKEDN
jgi:hypothetical protein